MKRWTYSSLDKFNTCPKQYYHLRVVRDVVDPPSPQKAWGETVHTALELYVKEGKPLPVGMEQWQSFVDKLLRLPGEVFTEHEFAIDRNFQPCSWDDAWSRGIADLFILGGDRAVVVDYKTGKRKPSEQLCLYALYVFATHPEVEFVHTCFAWLKDRKVDKQTYHRSEMSDLWQEFLPTLSRLESSHDKDYWPPRPSGLCRKWCPVVSCEHNGLYTP